MALVPCPDCGAAVSTDAAACPRCGCRGAVVLKENRIPTPFWTYTSAVVGFAALVSLLVMPGLFVPLVVLWLVLVVVRIFSNARTLYPAARDWTAR